MEAIPVEFAELYEEAKKLIKSDSSAQQVLVVLTSKYQMYHFTNHDIMSADITEEETFIKMLMDKNDAEVKYMVCMWDNFMLDVPSQHFRSRLTQINPLNGNTRILLQGNETWTTKELIKTVSNTGSV